MSYFFIKWIDRFPSVYNFLYNSHIQNTYIIRLDRFNWVVCLCEGVSPPTTWHMLVITLIRIRVLMVALTKVVGERRQMWKSKIIFYLQPTWAIIDIHGDLHGINKNKNKYTYDFSVGNNGTVNNRQMKHVPVGAKGQQW